MAGIEAVVLDIGGVLEIAADGGEPTQGFAAMVAGWEARLGLQGKELAGYLTAKREDGATGACSYEAWRAGLRDATGASADDEEAFLGDFWNLYLGMLNQELADWLRGLRPRYRTALLSNSFVGAREREEARYGFSTLAETIVYSHEVGVEKPARRIYEVTCERLGVAPEAVVFLDDVDAYVAGARAVGMAAVHFRSNAQAMAEVEALLA